MRALVTVIGMDKIGIIASVCTHLAEKRVNILDISQTIQKDYFTMIMLVDVGACDISFSALSEGLGDLGQSMDLNIRIQREEIFNAMHRI